MMNLEQHMAAIMCGNDARAACTHRSFVSIIKMEGIQTPYYEKT